jgi:hypothetical protein
LPLLLLTAAIIVAGGAIPIGIHVRERRALVRDIKEHGGIIDWRLIGPERLRSGINEDFDEIYGVIFPVWTGAPVNDASLACIRKLPNLKRLSLDFTNIGDAGMVHVAHLRNLKRLDLDETDVSDASVPLLCQLTQLRDLSLRRSKVNEAGVAELKRAIPGLKVTR